MNPLVHGINLDNETRCIHYHSDKDIIAILFKCCQKYYACIECHHTLETHEPIRWEVSDQHMPTILCGHCSSILCIQQYFNCGSQCPYCQSLFNPSCAKHHDLYFK